MEKIQVYKESLEAQFQKERDALDAEFQIKKNKYLSHIDSLRRQNKNLKMTLTNPNRLKRMEKKKKNPQKKGQGIRDSQRHQKVSTI